MAQYSEALLRAIKAVKGKRAQIVVQHILEHGYITTEALESQYGYKHPPRAVRDVREQGIPIETFTFKDAEGRTIAAYRFGEFTAQSGKGGGRKGFSKQFKQALVDATGSQCAICLTPFESRYLQIDHRVPYEVAGETETRVIQEYMLLCGSCNRAKSWSCEHCDNWNTIKNPDLCRTCYWGNPENYEHIALQPLRRLDITWQADEVGNYMRLKEEAKAMKMSLADYVKRILKQQLDEGD